MRKIRRSRDRKYANLLISLLISLIFAPFVSGIITNLLLSFFFLVTLIAIVTTFEIKQRFLILYLIIIFFAFALQLLSDLEIISSEDQIYAIIVQSIHIIYLGAAVYLIFKDILTSRKVTLDTILGAICIYLLIGILWALMYGVCATIDLNSFSQPLLEKKSFRILIYFSFTTLTTVGYGDISPVGPLARTLTNLQAIIGQMYPAIIISILVSIYTSDRTR